MKKKKLHIGCGTIYLKDFINMDSEPDVIINNIKELKEFQNNITSLDNYYKHNWGESPKLVIADLKSEISDLPFNENEIDEIVMLHVLEHIPLYDIEKNMKEIYRVLKKDGSFYVAVPDIKGFAEEFVKSDEEKDEWYIRCIYGTQRSQWDHHFCGYTKFTLEKLLKSYGFKNIQMIKNINFYPSIHMKAFK